MVPDDKELAELGARVYLDELDKRRAALIARYPGLVPISQEVKRLSMGVATELGDLLVEKAKTFAKAHRVIQRRRRYSAEFKSAAVGRVSGGEYAPDVAKSEGINEAMLRNWCKAAGVTVPKMSVELRMARMRGDTKALTPPLPKKQARGEFGLNLLKAMPDDKAVHYRALAAGLGEEPENVTWHIRQQMESKHIRRVGHGKGLYQKTKKGMRYQQKGVPVALPPP